MKKRSINGNGRGVHEPKTSGVETLSISRLKKLEIMGLSEVAQLLEASNRLAILVDQELDPTKQLQYLRERSSILDLVLDKLEEWFGKKETI